MATKPWGVFVRTYPTALSDIQAVGTLVNSSPKYSFWFNQFAGTNNTFRSSEYTTLLNAGITPIMTWQPRYNDHASGHILSADILGGTYDSLIASYAQGIAALNGTVLVRLMHEMNGTWDDWMIGQNDYTSGAVYAATYQYIVNKFRASVAGGVPNAKFVFCPNVHFSGETATYAACYPGDAYVDYLALDGYNYGDPTPHFWQTYSVLFGQSITDLVAVAPSKPFYINEIGSVEGFAWKGHSKAVWIEDALARIRTDSRVNFFIWNHSIGTGGVDDFHIDTSVESQLAFASALVQTTSFGAVNV